MGNSKSKKCLKFILWGWTQPILNSPYHTILFTWVVFFFFFFCLDLFGWHFLFSFKIGGPIFLYWLCGLLVWSFRMWHVLISVAVRPLGNRLKEALMCNFTSYGTLSFRFFGKLIDTNNAQQSILLLDLITTIFAF